MVPGNDDAIVIFDIIFSTCSSVHIHTWTYSKYIRFGWKYKAWEWGKALGCDIWRLKESYEEFRVCFGSRVAKRERVGKGWLLGWTREFNRLESNSVKAQQSSERWRDWMEERERLRERDGRWEGCWTKRRGQGRDVLLYSPQNSLLCIWRNTLWRYPPNIFTPSLGIPVQKPHFLYVLSCFLIPSCFIPLASHELRFP